MVEGLMAAADQDKIVATGRCVKRDHVIRGWNAGSGKLDFAFPSPL
jgi:hypothetical protein